MTVSMWSLRYGTRPASRYPNMRNRRIEVRWSEYRIDSDECGTEAVEIDSHRECDAPCESDAYDMADGSTTAVHMAVAALRKGYVTEASSTDGYPGTWYTETYDHPYTGNQEVRTYTLRGFTPAEEVSIFRRMAL